MTDSWVATVYNLVAIYGAFVALYVGHKTRSDVINAMDPPFLRRVRLLSFIIIGLALLWSVSAEWERTKVILGLVLIGVCNLSINAMALYFRSGLPHDGVGHPVKARVQAARIPPPLPRRAVRS